MIMWGRGCGRGNNFIQQHGNQGDSFTNKKYNYNIMQLLSTKAEHFSVGISQNYSTFIFIAMLFTIAKLQNNSKHPSVDNLIKKMLYVRHNGAFVNHKGKKITVFRKMPAIGHCTLKELN